MIRCIYMNANDATAAIAALEAYHNPPRAQDTARFFKTGPGQYGEGDMFWGTTVPVQRKIAKQYAALPLAETLKLLRSPVHDCRLTALFILVAQYRRGTAAEREAIYQAYLANMQHINNWDLVDSSAEHIVGPHQAPGDTKVLESLARSENLWERRIAMLACFWTIKQGDPAPAFVIINLLRDDPHDLIQKAVGWMLREIGKRCGREHLLDWLLTDKRYRSLPRTTLRYAIEHFDASERQAFLRGTA